MSEDAAPASTSEDLESSATETNEPVVIPFKAATDDAREVDPAELIGKAIKTIYRISRNDEYELPGSYGIAFRDGSKYHVRIHAIYEEGDVEYEGDIDEDEFEGKTITACSLLSCTGEFFDARIPGILGQDRIQYTAIGFKVDGSEKWNLLYGSEESGYDSDGWYEYSTFYDVFLICVNRPGRARAGRRGQGRR
ncbi:hypothetical protein Hypma_006880 [Hypsizygus marmoreus]|uniref:Uncharacterized protein n=1 Tax=Hypsizygus marmoreus TaxID=39966 RepID=A0A369JZ23_HYPMA|nr:hypothetical protein Hypma_006880 [Hypsizygus marmoreus]